MASSCAFRARVRPGSAADRPATSTCSSASASIRSSAARVTISSTCCASRRHRPRSAMRSVCRRSTAPTPRCASPPARSTARSSGSVARGSRTTDPQVAAISSCISTSSCHGIRRRTRGVCTDSSATWKVRHRRTATVRISLGASKTRWVAASTQRPRWLEIAVPAHAEAVEAVSEILSRYGHNGIAVELPLAPRGGADHTVKAYLVEDVDSYAKVSDARDALGHLQAFGLGPIGDLAVRAVDDEDWLESWKATVTPVRIGRFLVRPTWSDASAPDAITIVLDPGMAFGTGLHPTTQQCLEAVSYMDVEGLRVLDVGTGSGILAIAAAKRGAREVVGVDTDPLAVRAAKENAEANGVTVDARSGSAADVDGAFDVVLANLVGPVLVEVAPHLRARLQTSGSLVAAGITTQAERDVLSAFVAEGLGVVDRDERSDWVRLVMTA